MNVETFSLLLVRSGMTQRDFAEAAKISLKTVSRILSGENNVRKETKRRIAETFGVPESDLEVAPKTENEEKLRALRYQKVSGHVPPKTVLSYDLIRERYGLSFSSIVGMAPALFMILAELSLKDRKKALSKLEEHLEGMRSDGPPYFDENFGTFHDLEEAVREERKSIESRDISGSEIEVPFHAISAIDDLFVSYLKKLTRQLACPEMVSVGGGSTTNLQFQILSRDIEALAGDDGDAKRALTGNHARISEIPSELRRSDKAAERADWLRSKLPQPDPDLIEAFSNIDWSREIEGVVDGSNEDEGGDDE